MATLKQCDRCKIIMTPAKIMYVIKAQEIYLATKKETYDSQDIELCEKCSEDFVKYMRNVIPGSEFYSFQEVKK